MLLVNLDVVNGLCNGSRGVVVGFEDTTKWPVVKFTEGDPILIKPFGWEERSSDKKWTVVNTQIPLKLAYGITIHKSQGLSIDMLEINLEKAWECGQAYVALSRARTLEGLSLVGRYNVDIFQPHPKVLEFYKQTFGNQEIIPVKC
jgi:ATP-dependent DNA helicase PIF1